ncbi:alcohol dehydrogenase catalytic domain-containing protein [Asanoa sp. WMMD1127]|uniref:alcohol dehydrogenase catalytic domain-containing protein n=1 Tax=Asanoa sp. WMMD1127 TaxID=3016107 RepID=UPI0024177944|nr:alcohol dehydrogenase catalytic domain-containing protein [Asanoa sp. WMMD1127]MDG4826185.1 alcohol dehydrogenase catalytic domain-containing protein [Asanoa sp. WMMD1127]
MKALIVAGKGDTPRVADVVLPPAGPGEVRVRIQAAGVCHSDLSMVNGTLSPSYPLVLGHEAAGVVVEVGPGGGERVGVGDHVVLNWAPPCRECWHCTHGEPWLCAHNGRPSAPRGNLASGENAHVTLGLGALAEEVVVPSHAVVPVPADLPADIAALLGCAVLTATGAVNRTAAVRPGQSVVVVGLGGVGLAALIAARSAGADPVIGVDLSEAKRDLALKAGATDFVVSDDGMPKAVRGLTEGRGADHAIECVGRSATIGAAWRATRRGGQVTVVGMGARDDLVSLGALDIFHSARTLRSSVYGSSDPDRDLPALAAAVLDGSLDLTPLITDRIPLESAPAAFERMARGEGARSVVLFG